MVILSGTKVNAKIGDDVKIGAGAVVMQTSIGSNSVVGKGAYLGNSTFPANTVIPPKAIYINNKFWDMCSGELVAQKKTWNLAARRGRLSRRTCPAP